MNWLSSQQFAEAADIAERNARHALQRAVTGKSWHGVNLIARIVKGGPGGSAGTSYQVRLDSLPTALQERLKATPAALPAPLHGRALRRQILFGVLSPILAHPKGSVARADAIRAACERAIVNPDSGKLERPHIDTVRRWLREYDAKGLAALTRKRRADKGVVKVTVTRKFDAWARGAGLELAPIANALRDYIRAQHKNLEGESAMRFKAALHLKKLAKEAGQEPPKEACEIPVNVVRSEALYRRVGEFRKDRKKFQDDMPGVRRTVAGLLPMDIIVGDVHPLDFLLPEYEGYQRYAKAICWTDVATGRLWATVIVPPKGEGIRNEHVIESFIDMVNDWGLPKTLYLDNGSEYNFAEFIEDALQLVGTTGERALIRAKPYNARAKVIEGRFSVLRHYLAKLPGYIGGNRMKSKVANVGKAPVAFDGSFAAFEAMIQAAIIQYHHVPATRGEFKGRAPFTTYEQFIENGWHKTAVEQGAFAAAFSVETTRIVTKGVISIGNHDWTCDELARFTGQRVTVLIPKYQRGWERLPFRGQDGDLFFAAPVEVVPYLSPEGAKEASRREALRVKAVRALEKSAPNIDPHAELMELAASLPKQLAAPVGGCVTASDEARAIAKGVWKSAKDRRKDEEAKRRLQREKREADQAASEDFLQTIKRRKSV